MKKILAILLIFLSVLTFSSDWATLIDKTTNMYRLDENVYRSKQLSIDDMKLLQEYDIKTIISLRYFGRNKDEKVFGDTELNLISRPLKTWNISPKEIALILNDIQKGKEKGNVLIHCYHGSDRTGLISAMYRIIYQGWDNAEALKELKEGPYGYHKIWINIPRMFTDEVINEIKNELKVLD
ncbi:tyrosine-protein phosphatase [Streptobacillus felis]|uniref:Tyrosine-protein phosphatase n=1 Tax=Streptobacillus felis TaxID=1384509 RepID=A0A7Z0PHG2_9FUSO|nr:tyrosine-protein phosphatase [Streptobacillus felis]NYV28075.1 tyrosine-protein phosphatase [Streptobacillus felis]